MGTVQEDDPAGKNGDKVKEIFEKSNHNMLKEEDPAAYFQPDAEVQQSKQNEEHVKSQLSRQKPKEDSAAEGIATSNAPVIESRIVKTLAKFNNVANDKDIEKVIMELIETTTDDEWQKYFPQVPWTKTQILNRIKLIKQRAATKSNVKREYKENKPGLISGTAKDGPGDSNRIPDTFTTLSQKDRGEKESWELEGGDTSSAPVTGLQSEIVESATFHEEGTAGKEGDKVEEVFEKSKESVFVEEPEKDSSTDSIQEQVDTNFAAPNESHNAIVAEDRVPKTNEVIETTTTELSETESDKVCITDTVNDVEPNVTKEPAMVEKDNSTEETTVEPKEKEENDETITANVDAESGPNPLTCESDEYSVAGEVVATFANSKVSNEEPNILRMGGKSSIANKEISKEPDPSSNHEQVKEPQSKAEKLINTEDSESHTSEKEPDIHPTKKEATTENKTKKSKGEGHGEDRPGG